MSKPVNLNKFRKARARDEKRQRADENAIRFGRTRAEKDRDAKTSERAKSELDGKRRDPQ